MDIEIKKKALQGLQKALALMPEDGKEVEVEVKSEGPMHEESEEPGTVESEMQESPEEQMKEMAEGSEMHPEAAKMAMEKKGVKMGPSVMEKLALDDLSLDELKQIKEKLKARGLI